MKEQGVSPRFRFPRYRRLSGAKSFERVFRARCSAADRLLVIYACRNGLPYSRLGLAIGRKLGGAARRNRVKRLIREAYRLEAAELPPGFDFVCVARAGHEEALDEFRRSFRISSRRAIARCGSGFRGSD